MVKIPSTADDQPCTACAGRGKHMLWNGYEPCDACDATGYGLRERMNADKKEPNK